MVTEPTENFLLYIPRLTLWKDTVVKAKAFKLGMVSSKTAEAGYIINGGNQPDADGDNYDENDTFAPEPKEEIEEELLAGEAEEIARAVNLPLDVIKGLEGRQLQAV